MSNPLIAPSPLPYHLPDFTALRFGHYREAFEAGLEQHRSEIAAITGSDEPPTFANTVVALERAGEILGVAQRVFFNKIGADSDDDLRALEADIAPVLAAHADAVTLDPQLYRRIRAVRDAGGLDEEDGYLVERYLRDFELRGAALDDDGKEQLRLHNTRLAELKTEFGRRLQADTNDSAVLFDDAAELDGLSTSAISAYADAARARGLDGKYLVTLVLPTAQPALASLTNRESRRRIHEAAVSRGRRGNANDTGDLILEMVRIRAERAALLGYPTHAAYAVADQTAATPEAIEERVYPMAGPAARNALAELAVIQERADREQDAAGTERFEVAAHDWAYYSNRVRAQRYNVDTAALRPYFELERVLRDGVFHAAERVYGLSFVERTDLVGYHPDVRVFEVLDADGSGLGLFLHDVYARDSKRGGAWMNNLVDQSTLLGRRPVVCNNLNVPKPSAGEPTLLTLDEVRTMFHEFGHALHGLLADTRYPSLSGTSVGRDFVEFPSQVNEMWIEWPEIIAHYAVHHETGEALDPDVVRQLAESALWGEGYETAAYLAAALLDQEWHKLSPAQAAAVRSIPEFERAALAEVGLLHDAIPPRYSTTYFNHVFGSGYDAAYYSYIWSEVLDADTVEWFKENGGLTRQNGEHFRRELLSRGRSRDPMASYVAFRGREPEIEPLLRRRGLQ
ncbi:M3 family metallopeptidase [Cumulibacter manganitolerans]|uniref:M3 family metallopeptidase n=1 Tax=Cumulibacter manganitolerans TaxID=1884992 RepID=UPI001294F469|nr:M3 family metallopeptidase [Cumulibacter manganitolerans]